jgi:MFS family permease
MFRSVGRSTPTPRDLKLFYLFRLLATSYLYVPIFMLFQQTRGLSFSQRLALGGLYSVVVILVEVPTGVFADRLGRRRSMMLGAAAMIGSCLVAFQADSFAWFAVAEVLAATSIALCSGADSAYLYDLLGHHGRAHEYPRRESTASAMHLLGSAIAFAGGGFAATFDLSLPYLLTAVVALCALIVAAMLGDDRQRQRRHAAPPAGLAMRGWRRDVMAAIAQVTGNRRLLWLVGYSAVVFTLLRATLYIYQPYLDQRGFDTGDIGLLFAAMYVAASLVAYRTHSLRACYGDEPLLWGLLAMLAGSFVLLSQVSAGPWLLVLFAVQAIASGIYSPLTKPLLHREIVGSGQRAAVLSVESMARRVTLGAFAPLAGLYGQAHIMVLCGVVGLIGMVALALWKVASTRAAKGPRMDHLIDDRR